MTTNLASPSANSAIQGHVHLEISGAVAAVTFDRPQAHNAMTWPMYLQLSEICEALRSASQVRVATFRGTGGSAFIAGTDIAQFLAFESGEDGVAYETRIDRAVAEVEQLPMPTLAICEGWVMGGGLAIAAACDLRIASEGAKFGVPIARTLGNCLSRANTARLVAALGVANAKRVLLLGEALSAKEARECGFVAQLVESSLLDARAKELCQKLEENAPITMRVSKEMIRRIGMGDEGLFEDLISACYGSDDFKEGVRSFMEKRKPRFTGR